MKQPEKKNGITRRDFIKSIGIAGLGLGTASVAGAWIKGTPVSAAKPQPPPPGAQVPLGGNKIPQFVDQLPALNTIVDDPITPTTINLIMKEFQSPVMPSSFVNTVPAYTGTWVWGYRTPGQADGGSYIGPIIVATRGSSTTIRYTNNLGSTAATHVLAYKNSTDLTLHWANPNGDPMMLPGGLPNTGHYDGAIPAVAHLHGGEVPAVLDGGPDAWYTSNGSIKGHAYYTSTKPGDLAAANEAIYRYPNKQEAGPLWFHDHTLGATRLNVYAGLAGGYILVDSTLGLPTNLQGPAEIIPLVIQDRMFDVSGQLYFPSVGINPDHPYWIPEFVGDTIVVNGKV
jgi:spore coat protein A, manganese oxidase